MLRKIKRTLALSTCPFILKIAKDKASIRNLLVVVLVNILGSNCCLKQYYLGVLSKRALER